MIDAVLMFGFLNVLFEFVLLCMLKPRTRLRLLGSHTASAAMHVSFLLLNLMIHWGTLIGTMSAILAFISSLLTLYIAKRMFGFIVEGRFYTVGIIGFSVDELRG